VEPNALTDGALALRPLHMSDAEEWLAGEDEEQRRWFEAPRPGELSDVEAFIARTIESWELRGEHRYWAIRRVNRNEIVGGIDLRSLGDDDVNVSYVVFPEFRRHGIAAQAVSVVLSYAATDLGAHRALFKMLPGNRASERVAIGAGATYLGEEPSNAGATFKVFELRLLPGI